MHGIYNDYYLSQEFGTVGLPGSGAKRSLEVGVPVIEASAYAFQAPEDWGRRDSQGRIQILLDQLVSAQIDVDTAVDRYGDYIKELLLTKQRLETEVDLQRKKWVNRADFQWLTSGLLRSSSRSTETIGNEVKARRRRR